MKQIYLEKTSLRSFNNIVASNILEALKRDAKFIFNIFLIQNFRKGPPGPKFSPVAIITCPGLFNFYFTENSNQSIINQYLFHSILN